MNASKKPWCDVCGADDGTPHDVYEHVLAVLEENDLCVADLGARIGWVSAREVLARRVVEATKLATIANVTIALGGGS